MVLERLNNKTVYIITPLHLDSTREISSSKPVEHHILEAVIENYQL